MKTILLTAVLIIGYTLTVFAQQPSILFPENRLMKLKTDKPAIVSFPDSFNKGKLNVPFDTRNFLLKYSKDKELKIAKPAGDNLVAQGGMPIFRPEGSFPMPVYKPDTTIRFTMQIWEYNKMPFIDFR